jgi:GNAT superfamily N-acetyltransferase
MTTLMRIARAEPTDECLEAVLGLIEEARGWLWTKGTDQWAKPWPNEEARDARVFKGLQGGKTPGNKSDLAERAVFMHRLVTARKYAGLGLGAQLTDWAGLRGQRLYGAKWIRIDVWRTNRQLHEYYQRKGFEACGFCADPEYPSSALFQKPVATISAASVPVFAESPHQAAAARSAELSRPAAPVLV